MKREKISFFYRFIRALARPLFSLLYGVKIIGRENIPKSGAYLVCANHMCLFDPVFIMLGAKRQIHFLTKIEVFKKPIIRALAKAAGAIPIDRGIADMSAIRASINILSSDRCVGIFPQGTRCRGRNPSETKIKSGMGLLAYRAKANILPVNITTKNYTLRPFRKVTVTFGKPIMYDELGFESGNISEFYGAASLIFDRICNPEAKAQGEADANG